MIQCFVCNTTFDNKPNMMAHRKKNHSDIIRQCTQFNQNCCRFQEEACWFKHDIANKKDANKDEARTSNDEDNSVFQKATTNLKPPFETQKSPVRENKERI